MAHTASLYGVHTAIVTPFTVGGDLDRDGYARVIARQIAAGVHGIVACGTTGETPTLTHPEWQLCVRDAVTLANGRVPVTAGVGTNDTRTTVLRVQEAAALGADLGLLVFPYYNKPNADGLRQHVRAAAAVGLPLVLYHVPGRTGQRLTPSLLAELAELEGIVGVKEATGDLRLGGDLITRTRTPVLSGDDFTFLPLLALGGAGVVSVVSNVAPAHTVAIWAAHRAGRVDEAAARMAALWPLVTFLFDDTNPVPCKAALAALGVCGDTVRLPLAPHQGPDPRPLLDALGLSA